MAADKTLSRVLTRREVLTRVLSLAAAASSGWLGLAPERVTGLGAPGGAREPSGTGGVSFFSSDQKKTVSALANLIIPADRVSLGAKAAGVADYIDSLVAHAAPEEQQAWVDGLRALDQLSPGRFGSSFSALQAEQQDRLLAGIAREESSPQSPAAEFFVRAKHATAEGFYTSKIGLIEDLKYQGNAYVEAPATCADQFGSGQASTETSQGNPHKKRAVVPAPQGQNDAMTGDRCGDRQ